MKTLLYGLAGLLALASCRKDSEAAAPNGCGAPGPAGYRVLLRVDPGRNVPPGPTGPGLAAFDNQAYPTTGYALVTDLQRQDNALRLSYCGVTAPQVGLTIPAPARSQVSLSTLEPRVYQLEITVRDRRTTGTLDLTTTPARLTTADSTVAAVRL